MRISQSIGLARLNPRRFRAQRLLARKRLSTGIQRRTEDALVDEQRNRRFVGNVAQCICITCADCIQKILLELDDFAGGRIFAGHFQSVLRALSIRCASGRATSTRNSRMVRICCSWQLAAWTAHRFADSGHSRFQNCCLILSPLHRWQHAAVRDPHSQRERALEARVLRLLATKRTRRVATSIAAG